MYRMRLSQANKILLGSCVVVVPLSIYGGTVLKERYLAKELDRISDVKVIGTHSRARIVELQQERAALVDEGRKLDTKIADLRRRMSEKEATV